MKYTLLIFAAIVLMAGCNKTTKTDKDMNTLTFNEKQAAAMSAIACYARNRRRQCLPSPATRRRATKRR